MYGIFSQIILFMKNAWLSQILFLDPVALAKIRFSCK